MEKAFFNNIRSEIIPLLNQAKEEVIIAMAWFTSGELFQALLDCIKRKVKVELVLLDHASNFMYYAPDFNRLIDAGGVLRIAKVENGFMHHKFCVIDDCVVITGSYNWTYFAETRNIENIVISDNKEVIYQYKEEFKSLASQTSKTIESPRLNWEEIENCHDLNFDDLNYEIKSIAEAQHLQEIKVIKSETTVTIEERPMNPISKYDIGIQLSSKGNNRSMETIIPAGSELPYTSKPITLYNYTDHRDNVLCYVVYNDGVLSKSHITDIIANRNEWELTIKIQYTLHPSGVFVAEIRCVETGKVMTVKASKPELVDYAK